MLFEAFLLVDWVIKFTKRISVFGCVDEILKSFSKCGFGRFSLCKRAIFNRIIINECWLNEFFLYICVKDFNKDSTLCCVFIYFYMEFLCNASCVLIACPCVVVSA